MEAVFSKMDEWFEGGQKPSDPPPAPSGDQPSPPSQGDTPAAEAPSGYDWSGGTLQIQVSDPQKAEKNMMTHLIYTVRCWTTLNTYANRQNCVQRRFSDFEWLRGKLRENNPGIIIPAVPEKTMVNYDDPACDTIQERLFGLNQFVTQIAAHPVLRADKSLQLFLESGCAELSSWYDRGVLGSVSTSVFGSVTSLFDSFMSGPGQEIAASLGTSTTATAPAFGPNEYPNLRGAFTVEDMKYHDGLDGVAVQAYLTKLQGCLQKLVDQSDTLAETSVQEARAMKNFARSLIALGEASEGGSVNLISSMAALKETENGTYNWGQIGTYMRAWIVGPAQEQPNKIKATFLRPLRFSSRLANSAVEMIADREAVLSERKQVLYNYVTTKEKLDHLVIVKGAGEDVDNARADFLEAERRRKMNTTKYECFESRSVKELAHLHSQISKALGPALRGFAQVQGRLAGHTAAAMMKVNIPGGTLTDPTGLPIPSMLQGVGPTRQVSRLHGTTPASTSGITAFTHMATKTIMSTANTATEYAYIASEYASNQIEEIVQNHKGAEGGGGGDPLTSHQAARSASSQAFAAAAVEASVGGHQGYVDLAAPPPPQPAMSAAPTPSPPATTAASAPPEPAITTAATSSPNPSTPAVDDNPDMENIDLSTTQPDLAQNTNPFLDDAEPPAQPGPTTPEADADPFVIPPPVVYPAPDAE